MCSTRNCGKSRERNQAKINKRSPITTAFNLPVRRADTFQDVFRRRRRRKQTDGRLRGRSRLCTLFGCSQVRRQKLVYVLYNKKCVVPSYTETSYTESRTKPTCWQAQPPFYLSGQLLHQELCSPSQSGGYLISTLSISSPVMSTGFRFVS